MQKVIRCREVGFDCDGVIKADTQEEALKQAAEHAKNEHGVNEVSPEMVQRIMAVMEEEE